MGLFTSFIGPLIIYVIGEDKDVKRQSANALNWQISLIIYSIISSILIFVVIGIVLLIALSIMNLVFCIMAAVKANEGEEWKYPMTIQFLKS
ncbi:MAG: DUF4870 domain-containing protein [Candidatus Woesearchaeota archaeon]